MRVQTDGLNVNLQYHRVDADPFRVYGLLFEKDQFCRMPEERAKAVSKGVYDLHRNTSGGRVRFVTDSARIGIRAKLCNIAKMSHFSLTGSAGFDLYTGAGTGQVYCGTFRSSFHTTEKLEGVLEFTEKKERIVTINFPLYSDVSSLEIGLDPGAEIKAAPDYRYEKPIVYYGSSITQGGCASRPGNSYQNIISRHLDVNYVNLGFSDSGRAETAMAEYLSGLKMRAFICDYDHNAPDVLYLEKTHFPLYRTIREKQEELPIVFVTAPEILQNPEVRRTPDGYEERREVIRRTFQRAQSLGDRNVYFIDGAELFEGEDYDACTVDGRHPNDLGFYRMARRIEKEIVRFL